MGEQPFNPDWRSPPGDTVADILLERELTTGWLMERTGFAKYQVDLLLAGDFRVTPMVASRLSDTLGGSEEFWLERERHYREPSGE